MWPGHRVSGATPWPTTVLTSDPDYLTVLCGSRVAIIEI